MPEKQAKTLWQCSPVDWEGNEGINGLVMAQVILCKCWESLTSFLRFLSSLQKRTQYRSDPGKYNVYNVTDNSPVKIGDNEEIIKTIVVNATVNITTISQEEYPSSDTIPVGVGTNPTGGMNILGLAVFSIVFGIILGRMGPKAKPLTSFFSALNDAVMILVTLIMW